jgi:pyruvate,water dikinase
VAREYGIPAVLGTGMATHRIQSGDILEVNGSEGRILIKAHASQSGGNALEWPLPRPKVVLARGSFAEFVPEPVSPLFATLAVPLARDASNRLMHRMGVSEKDSYLFEVINSYLYIGMVFTPKMTWQMSKASLGMLKSVLKTSRQQALTEREKFISVIQKWQLQEIKELEPSELLTGVREIFRSTAEYYNMAQSATIPTSLMSEAIFGMVYKTLVKRKSDPDAPTFLFGSENQAIRQRRRFLILHCGQRTDRRWRITWQILHRMKSALRFRPRNSLFPC